MMFSSDPDSVDITQLSQEEQDNLIQALLTRFRLYTSFGIAALVLNAIIVVVHLSNREMFKRYILFTMLSLADLINGASFVAAGVGREMLIHERTYFTRITTSQCLTTLPWPILLVFAGQLPAAMNLMLAIERVIAVECSMWYRRVWTWKYKAMLGTFGYAVCAIGFGIGVYASHLGEQVYQARMCSVMESTGVIYGSVHYSLISLAYLASFIVILVIFMITRANKKLTDAEFLRQKILFAVIGVSVVFVSFPNAILVLNEWHVIDSGPLFVGVAYCLYAISSTFNLFIYIAFRHDFRQQLLILVCLGKKNSTKFFMKTTTVIVTKASSGA